jgi:hypothetical protein
VWRKQKRRRKREKKKKKKKVPGGPPNEKKGGKKEGAEKKAAFECKKCPKKIIYSYRLKSASLPEWPPEFPGMGREIKKKKISLLTISYQN